MPQPPSVEELIRTLASQRPRLGDAAVDFAIAALREKALAVGAPVGAPESGSAVPRSRRDAAGATQATRCSFG